ncbi:GNAT family N-acetyltransferase [Nonomuraea sp. 3N208]|uniref:GNAT family N-acetyltransferase n=1 Tax=Nonomuraea sp. 3N208 TaxID=3457421 RepID=UPI003FCD9AB9
MLPRDVISSGPLILRPPVEGDTEGIVKTCGDPVTAWFLPALPSPYAVEDARDYFAMAAAKWEAGGAEFAISENGQYVGSVGVRPPDPWGVAEIGYVVAPWARGKDVASTAARAVTDWVFDHGIRRVELQTAVENVASLRVAYKSGFREEGRRRDAKSMRDGRYVDLVTFARLKGDVVGAAEPYLPFFEDGRLSDGVVRLEPLAAGDAADFHRMVTEPSVAAYSMMPPSTMEDDERRCRYTGYWWVSGQRIELAIRDAASGAFAGHVQLTQVLPALGQAMIGYSLVPDFRGKGFMTRAVNLLVDWAFAHTALHRIVAGTESGNVASHRVLERTGFQREGVHRELFPKADGGRVDDVAWARLRSS